MSNTKKYVRRVSISPVILYLFFHASSVYCQNLVANPSFELYDSCPTSVSTIFPPTMTEPTVQNWFNPTGSSSDYFNACYVPDLTVAFQVGVPNNFGGYQMARTGDAYAGGYAIHRGSSTDLYQNWREYIEAPLTTPLISGHRYYAGYWIALGKDDLNSLVAFDRWGIYFQEGYYWDDDIFENIPISPQIVSPPGNYYADTIDWQLVAGTFIADGGEDWIILGNFSPIDTNAYSKIFYHPFFETMGQLMSYYYYEDVCLLDLDGPPLESSYQEKALCINDTVIAEGRPGYRYIWDDGNTEFTRLFYEPGLYWVKSIDTNECSGYYLDSFEVIFGGQSSIIGIGNDTILCEGATLTLDASGENFTIYKWSTGDTTSVIEISNPGEYHVYASDGTCRNGVDTINISAFQVVPIQRLSDTIICKGATVSLHQNQTGFYYLWSTGEAGCCINVTDSGSYNVTAIDVCGNSQSDTVNVISTGCSDCLLVPTAFTPNNDGLNDRFQPIARCLFSNYVLRIYNRWGQNVYTSYLPENGWDGTFNGHPLDVGVYFYDIKAQPIVNGAGEVYTKGDITLLR